MRREKYPIDRSMGRDHWRDEYDAPRVITEIPADQAPAPPKFEGDQAVISDIEVPKKEKTDEPARVARRKRRRHNEATGHLPLG